MRTARHPAAWRRYSLTALLILGISPVPIQAGESPSRHEQLWPAKHTDPELPASKPAIVQKTAPVQQVLIATESSRFKEALVAQVAETLCRDQRPLLIKRIDLNRLTAEPIQNYHVIVLVNSCRAWQPSSVVREFLKSASDADKKKLVVLTTANSGECDLKVSGVDAISAASKRTGIAAVSQTVIDRVCAHLAAP